MTVTTWTGLYAPSKVVQETWLLNTSPSAASTYNVTVPVGATCGIMSAVAAGGWSSANPSYPGGGSSFARTKLSNLIAGEILQVQIGCPKFSLDAGTSQGDTIITRNSTSTVVCKASRGTGTIVNISTPLIVVNGGTPGLAINCIGDIKRDGFYGNTVGGIIAGGSAAGDDADTFSAGFGGRGAIVGRTAAAVPGGGGIYNIVYDPAGDAKPFVPGAGKACIVFWTRDPGSDH